MDRLRSTESSSDIPISAVHTAGRLPCSAVISRKSLPARGTNRSIMENRSEKDGRRPARSVMIFFDVIWMLKHEKSRRDAERSTAICTP